MAEEQKNIPERKRRRWPWVLPLALVAFLLLVRLSLLTRPVQKWVKGQIIAAANAQLQGELSIRKLNGDLWKEVNLTGIDVKKADTLVHIDTVRARYSLLSYFGNAFEVSEVRISGPKVKLQQFDDGSWNLQQLLKPAEPAADTTASSPFYFQLDSLAVDRGSVEVTAPQLLPDSTLKVGGLQVGAGLGIAEPGFHFTLHRLSFSLEKSKLGTPARVKATARSEGKAYSLQQLVLATGQSLLESSGSYNAETGQLNIALQAKPLSWRDIQAYAGQAPVRRDLKLSVDLQGSLPDLKARLKLQGTGVRRLETGAAFRYDSVLTVQSADLSADRIALDTLFADSTQPAFGHLQVRLDGRINTAQPEAGQAKGTFSASRIRAANYEVDQVDGTIQFRQNHLQAKVHVRRAGEKISADLAADSLLNDVPSWKLNLNAERINPGYWMQDTLQNGRVNFRASASGTGFTPSARDWHYNLESAGSTIGDQSIDHLEAKGQINRNRLTLDATLRMGKGWISLNGACRGYLDHPDYRFRLQTTRFNIARVTGYEKFPSRINMHIEGRGQYFNPSRMRLQSSVKVDSSVVNGELVRDMEADVAVADTVANVKDASLESDIADGTFHLRQHLLRLYDHRNRLDLDLKLNDLSSLAPLLDVKKLQSRGQIKGRIHPSPSDELELDASVQLNEVVYNDLLSVDRIEGRVHAFLQQEPEYLVNLDLKNPDIASVLLQDLSVSSQGVIGEQQSHGDFELQFRSRDDARTFHAGRFAVSPDSVWVRTDSLDISSDQRTLRLDHPFTASFAHGVLRTGTARVASPDSSAFMEMRVTYADSVRQRGYLKGRNLNMATIQSTLLNRTYFKGVLDGSLDLDRQPDSLSARGRLRISRFEYEKLKLDTLKLQADIRDDRLRGDIAVYDQQDTLVQARGELPFKLGNPKDFPDRFFSEPVKGSVDLYPTRLQRFSDYFKQMGIEESKGTARFHGELHGKAGVPQFHGRFLLSDAQLSGVPVDSVSVDLDYDHEDSDLAVDATVHSLKQKAAEIRTTLPLYVDMRTFGIRLPEKTDSIRADIVTRKFELGALNDFMDRGQVRDLKGELNGKMEITGPINNLSASGDMTLSNSSVRVVQAGITLDHIESELDFRQDRIVVKKLRMSSGGTLSADGTIALKGLVPGNLDLQVKADKFKAVNTRDYNAIVDLNSKVSGSVTRPKITGRLSFQNGFVFLRNFGEKSVEHIQLDSVETAPDVSLYDSLSLDLDVQFNRRFYVRNKRYLELEIELEGGIDLLKQPTKDLQIFGTLTAASGYAQPLGKRFDLTDGAVTFTGPPSNPELNIRTLYQPPQPHEDIKIWYVIEGTVEKPEFHYESDPQMELENILSYTLFGQPYYALDSWKQVVANPNGNGGASATNLAMDVLLDRVESLATQRLGIDVVQIDNTGTGNSSGTTIKTGWYLNSRVFFAILNEISGSTPDTMFMIQYMLQRNLELILTQGGDNRGGIDLRWQYDY